MQIDTPTQRFIDAARKAPKLSAEQELECISAWQARRSRRDAERLVKANLRHVVFLALKFRNYGVPVEDLISQGNVGLMKALERFDVHRGVRFGTYAPYWVRAEIVSAVLSSWRLTSGPRGALHSRVFFRLRRRRAQLALSGQEDATERLADEFGVSEQRMTEMLQQIDAREVSLDTPLPGSNETRLDELASDSNQESELIRLQENRGLALAVEGARPLLDARERFILEHRLLRDGEDQLSLAELAGHFGTSRERARQLEVRARGKLTTVARDLGVLAPGRTEFEPVTT